MATANTETLDKIRRMRSAASSLAGFHQMYDDKFKPNLDCDKKGYGFQRDNRFAAFDVKVSFDSWHGYYGDSSCSTILSVDRDLAKEYLVKALNVHQRELFATAARLMREDAAELTDKAQSEIDALQKMLETARQEPDAETAEAA